MNKTVTINLGGQIFYVEESVFDALQEYLDGLKSFFSTDPDGNEIIADIEYRLAELFIEGQTDRNSAISTAQVEEAIATMGTVSDFQEASESEEHSTLLPSAETSTSQNFTAEKRLMRDPEDRVFSGVSSGLGHYFGINALWIRLAFLVVFLFQGFGLIPYIILWIIMPKAVSTSDKLSMKGKPINLSTLRENVKTDQVNNSGSAADFVNQLLHYGGRFLITFSKIMLIFFGGILLLAGIGIIVATGFLAISGGDMPLLADSFIGMNGFWYAIMRIAAFLAIAVPVILFSVLFLRLLLNRNFLNDRRYLYVLGSVWLVSALVLSLAGLKLKQDFKHEGQNLESFQFVNSYDTLKVKVDPQFTYRGKKSSINISSDDFKIINDTLYSDQIQIDIVPADISEYRLDIIKTAKGKTIESAESRSASTNYYWEHAGDELLIGKMFNLPSNTQWRKQKVRLVLNVPYNQIVHLDRSTYKMIDNVDNIQNIYDRDMAGRSWSSTEAGLSCLDCDKEEINPATSYGKGQEINAIDIEGALSIKVIQSNMSKLEYSNELAEYYNFDYKGDKLVIRSKDDSIDGDEIAGSWAKIYVRDLSDIYIKGLAEVDLEDLKGDHLDIKIEGAAQTDFELDYASVDIEIQGAANVDMSGSVEELDLRAEGMMRIDAEDLTVSMAEIDMEGAMRADFHVTDEMNISLEGPSYIKYKGDPKISKTLSGPSRLVRM